jgi:cytochrome c553
MQRVTLGAVLALAAVQAATAQTTSSSTPHPGRLLASNCFQCHGTNGRSVADIERLAGKSASEVYNELREWQLKGEPDSIMSRHAKGYTDAQMRLIADYFSKQR